MATTFPVEDLDRLDEMLGRTRWIVPVLPKSELEILLDASIDLCKRKLDTQSEACQRFFRDGLSLSFVRVTNDEAVNTWKYDIYVKDFSHKTMLNFHISTSIHEFNFFFKKHIYNNSLKAIELCTLKLSDDWFPLLDLLALIFNPHCK
jgi:ubiquitin carboxyl-terminal hydrolase 9/24